MHRAPVLFISHGAPTFALEPGLLGARLQAIGAQLSGIRAVLAVSAHWQTRDLRVMTSAAPATLYDFRGFPDALYHLTYPAPGAPELAAQAARLLVRGGYTVSFDNERGLDHGVWVPLRFLLPHADVPVFQVSMPYDLDPPGALRLGRTLAPLRAEGILIVGSGSLTHNLSEFRPGTTTAAPYARAFSDWIRQRVRNHDGAALEHYRRTAPEAERAHPTDEHFLPLLIAQGASAADDAVDVLEGGIEHGMLSMDSFAWGLAPRATSGA